MGCMPVTRGRRIALSVAVALGVALGCLALELHAPSPAPVWPYPHEDSFGTMGAMALAVPLLVLWGVSVARRCQDPVVRRHYVAIDAMLVLWMVDALVKYCSLSDAAIAAGWYLYYVPLVFVPLLQLFCAMRTSGLDRRPWAKGAKRALVAAGVVLSVLVLTNGWHSLAFVFDPADPAWDVHYAYGHVYRAVFAWCVALVLLFFAVTVAHARSSLRAAAGLVVAVVAVATFYSLVYYLRLLSAFESNFCLTFSLFVVAIIEACLDLRLVPSYVGMDRLLRSLPLDVRVLDDELVPVCSSDAAGELGEQERARVASLAGGMAPGEATAFRLEGRPELVFKLFRIPGGTVLVAEDVGAVMRERRRLELRREELARRNEALARMRAAREELYASQAEQELCDDIDASLDETVSAMREAIRGLPLGEDAESCEERRRGLRLVRLLVGYCKRKGMLLLSEGASPDGVRLVMEEASSDARSSGVPCAATVGLTRDLTPFASNVVYDVVYESVLASFEDGEGAMIVFVGDGRQGGASLRVVLDAVGDGGRTLGSLREACAHILGGQGIPYELESDELGVRLVADVPPASGAREGETP